MPLAGKPEDTTIPPHLDRWNWGAFFFNWIWGIGNSTYIALLMFVPGVNIIMLFVLGAKGSKWAWKNRLWQDEAHFIRTQRAWARMVLAIFMVAIILGLLVIMGLPKIMKNSGAYIQSMEILLSNQVARTTLGAPIEEGYWISGQISLTNNSGFAHLSIPVSGPECSGTLISRADKENGVWEVYLLVLKTDCGKGNIILRNYKNMRILNATPPGRA